MRLNIATTFMSMLFVCSCTKLPSSFKKCNAKDSGFNKCLSEAIHNAIQQLNKPIPALGLPSLNPFRLPTFQMRVGNRKEGLEQLWKNVTLHGLTKPTTTIAKWTFGSESTLQLDVSFPVVQFDSDFEAHGRVVLLAVDVDTTFRITYEKPTFKLTFKMIESGQGSKHFKLVSTKLDMLPQKATFAYNLFDNKVLNDQINEESSKKFMETLGYIREDLAAFEPFFGNLLSAVLEKVPISDLIDGLN
ncbi:hypothetical protein Zmor_005325 [Zophobas morio]|uniref:Uncharacterized protein n=1 Tax=Zophobas morio TaxID=2755281 RepID=A0AA38IN32_9CUCU|nr:hypothetical protein Zmor_005325 [Zophobas morio]